jgi:predicted metal-dependent hydrolase
MRCDIKTITTKEFGEVALTRNKRSRYISLQVKPLEGLCVVAPRSASISEVESVIRRKSDWIKTTLTKIKDIEDKRTIFDLNTKFQTRQHRLIITPHNDDKVTTRVSDGLIKVKCPESRDIKDVEVQKAIREGIGKALKIEAKEYIPHRVRGLANKFGLKYRDIATKNIRTRWGSCSSNNNLNFNIHLMRLPETLIDYVIMHELAHTVEKNHSKKFWSLLDSFVGDSKKLDKDLKGHRIGLW